MASSVSSATSTSTALLFAGQGTDVSKSVKKITAGSSSLEAIEYYSRASDVVGYDLLDIIQNQPEKLKSTEFSQVAIFVTQLVTAYISRSNVEKASTHDAMSSVTCVAGFSLGEYAALVYAGAITFEDGVKLVKLRGEAMQVSAEETNGSMITVMGVSDAKLGLLCSDAMKSKETGCDAEDSIAIANHLFPKGRVLSGHKKLVQWVAKNAKNPRYGATMANELPVAGAFHSPYMKSSRDILQEALKSTDIQMPSMPVYSNVTAKPYTSVEEIRELLVKQLESPVLWEQTVKSMDGVNRFVDAGPNMQLKSMLRYIDPKLFKATTALDM